MIEISCALATSMATMYERGGAEVVQGMPGGAEWLAAVEAVPEAVRHLHVHEGHLVALTDCDRAALAAGGASMIGGFTLTGTPDEVRTRVEGFEAMGVTEVAIQPGGRDIPGELERFAAALELTRRAT